MKSLLGFARPYVGSLFIVTLMGMSASAAKLQVVPTTTVAAETGNNTSASDSISTYTRGYAASGNISKLPIQPLTYPGATTKIYAALMGWFGKASHISVGYQSNDSTQVKKQVEDMQSRGISGAILAWYGAGTGTENQTAQLLMQQSEAHPDFTFAIMVDQGTLQWNSMGLAPTDALIYHLNYLAQTYYPSSAYMRINGRPVVLEFGLEAWTIDWARVIASVQGNPLFIFRNPPAFTNVFANGAYSWGPADGLAYTDYFDKIAGLHPSVLTMGDGSKGFNDVLASWSLNRVVDQQCGQTWLNTLAETGKYYSPTNQLPYLQVATWNDYEEGTSIESGIDNCMSVSSSVSGTVLSWQIVGAGQENTLDHYTAFVSTDGINLMPVADIPTGNYTLDLSSLNLGPGNYTFYVKAVAKSSLRNHMSNAASFTVVNNPPVAVMSVTPTSGLAPLTVSVSMLGSSDADGSIKATSIDFGDGTLTSGVTASHIYSLAGTHTISATVTDDLGATATTTSVITVLNQAPHAVLSVTPTSGLSGVVVNANATLSYDSDGSISSSSIDFGDGTIISGMSGAHTYLKAGGYAVKATVTDNMGAISSASSLVTINNQAPHAVLSLNRTSGIVPTTISASATGSYDVDGTIRSASIDFGDGTVAPGMAASHSYKVAGKFTVTAKVTDNLGAVSTTTSAVTISPASVTITLPSTTQYAGTPVEIKAVALSGLPITGMWVYIDNVGVYTNLNSTTLDTFLAIAAGTHTVQVKAWDNTGHITSSAVSLSVSLAPRAAVSGRSGASPTLLMAARISTGSTMIAASTNVAPSETRASRLTSR